MSHILVADVMTRDPVTIKSDSSLRECAKLMIRKKVGSVLIAEKKKLLGFISTEDLLWVIIKKQNQDLSKIKAIDISPKKLSTINPFVTLDEAIKRMKKFKFERLPVVQNGELVGIITIKDILNFNPEIYPELEEFARIREESEKLRRINEAKSRMTIEEGICEECGHQDTLHKVNGMLICSSCRSEINED